MNDGEDEISGIFQGEPVGDILIYPSAKSLNAVIRDELGMHILNLPPGRWGYIGGIELPEDARGRGIGERMMRQMLAYAAQRGLRGIVLFSASRPLRFGRRWALSTSSQTEMFRQDCGTVAIHGRRFR